MNNSCVLHHDAAMVAALKNNPEIAVNILNSALADCELPGGQAAPMTVLRQMALAQGLEAVAERAGMSQTQLCQALQRKGSPAIKTFLAIIKGIGLRLKVCRAVEHVQEGTLGTSTMFAPPHADIT